MAFISAKMNSIYFDRIDFFLSISTFNSFYFCAQRYGHTQTHTIHPHMYTHSLLCNEVNADGAFDFEYRGPVMMKGKAEPMKCWFLNRAKCDYPNIPHAEDLMKSQIETSLTCGY